MKGMKSWKGARRTMTRAYFPTFMLFMLFMVTNNAPPVTVARAMRR